MTSILANTGKLTPPFNWQLGYLPVANHLTVVAGDLVASTDVLPVEGPTPRSSDFGRVHDYMETAGLLGSTEDLAFGPDDQLVIGVPGALLALDPSGAIARIETTGATLEEAARTLKAAGAVRLVNWVLSRTLPDHAGSP